MLALSWICCLFPTKVILATLQFWFSRNSEFSNFLLHLLAPSKTRLCPQSLLCYELIKKSVWSVFIKQKTHISFKAVFALRFHAKLYMYMTTMFFIEVYLRNWRSNTLWSESCAQKNFCHDICNNSKDVWRLQFFKPFPHETRVLTQETNALSLEMSLVS